MNKYIYIIKNSCKCLPETTTAIQNSIINSHLDTYNINKQIIATLGTMSFKFNEDVFRDNSFNEKIKEKLSSALNKNFNSRNQEKFNILKSEIIVTKTNFPTIPKFEILDLDINTQPRSLVKGICKIIIKDAMVQLQTVIESNLLLVNMKDTPIFIKPNLIVNNSLRIPITMTFKGISLEAISNIFVKNNSLSISFNDVNLDFKFDCSINILQNTIEKRLKDSMHLLFKEVLPTVLFNMSQSWFTNNHTEPSNIPIDSSSQVLETNNTVTPRIIFDDSDLIELSPKNMIRLSTIVSSRHTLSLHGTSSLHSMASIPGCLEKQNLYRFISRMPSLSNYYSAYRNIPTITESNTMQYSNDNNYLPERVLKEKKYDLNQIIDIQNKLYERSTADENEKPKRRTIKLNKKKKNQKQKKPEIIRQSTPIFEKLNLPKMDEDEIIPVIDQSTPLLHKEKSIHPQKINSIRTKSKRISFVGINNVYNNGWKWGNEDNTTVLPPPPYRL